jgi:hypothetical protein
VPGACVIVIMVLLLLRGASAQEKKDSEYFARVNTFGAFSSYSNDSSHILLGEAMSRKLIQVGVSYSRRLILNPTVNFQYNLELMPLVLESDPTVLLVLDWSQPPPPFPPINETLVPYSACHASSGTGTATFNGTTYTYTFKNTCGRQWTVGEAMSPVGLQLNFLPRKKMQIYVIGHGGYMYSTRPVPVMNSGSFNFTFDGGAGIELYRSHTRSIRAEYRYHHFSNKDTASANPGVDNGIFQVTYSFGR